MPRDLLGKFAPATRLQFQIENCIRLIRNVDIESNELETLLSRYEKMLLNARKSIHYKKLNQKIKLALVDALVEIDTLRGYSEESADESQDDMPECTIQIPSEYDLGHMQGMTAGGREDQNERLANMVEVVIKNTTMPIYSTDIQNLPAYWIDLFVGINSGNRGYAEHLFKNIPEDDFILNPLLKVHSEDYLLQLIAYCIQAQKTNLVQSNRDVMVTPKTFEILIKDLATTLYELTKVTISFSLPTHHAFSERGAGFCFINKTAIIMRYLESRYPSPLQYIIVGMDVNRDNGLCDILRQSAANMLTRHIDIFDPMVYPCQNQQQIEVEFGSMPQIVGNQTFFHKDNFEYFPVYLNVTTRNNDEIHPALQFALSKVQEGISKAILNGHKIALFVPIGWDSHEKETAHCGKYVKDHWLSKAQAKRSRFNDKDLEYFYSSLFDLYSQNKEHIHSMYWGIEGGYDKAMYEKQIELFMQVIDEKMLRYDTSPQFGGM